MIIERNIFYLKFGKAKEAIAIWNKYWKRKKTGLPKVEMRLLSDISGPAYTYSRTHWQLMILFRKYVWGNASGFQELYAKFIPLCEESAQRYYKLR